MKYGIFLSLCLLLVGCDRSAQNQERDNAMQIAEASFRKSNNAALQIAQIVLERLGGQEAWDKTRYISWNFFGMRKHYWDKRSNDIRIEHENKIILMNITTREGRAFADGEEITDETEKQELLDAGYAWWINDSYWMFMPYKLLDPGVELAYKETTNLPDGRLADVLSLTFTPDTGLTPNNRYDIYVVRDTSLVEQWSFYAQRTDESPRFTMPWADWRQYGEIWLASDKGRGKDWEIEVYDQLDAAIFYRP